MQNTSAHNKPKAWIVTVDMGYGHQRAAYPLRDLGGGEVIVMNDYPDLPEHERHVWNESREGYGVCLAPSGAFGLGRALFELFDRIQEIPRFYPRRDLSRPNFQLWQIYRMIEKKDWANIFLLTCYPKISRVHSSVLSSFRLCGGALRISGRDLFASLRRGHEPHLGE